MKMNQIQERILSFNQTWIIKIKVGRPAESASGCLLSKGVFNYSLNSMVPQVLQLFNLENGDFSHITCQGYFFLWSQAYL